MLKIIGLGSSGEGIATDNGLKCFIEGALPGEEVEVTWTKRKKNYAKGELKTILTPSKERVVPRCPVFGQCGGCQIMHLSYTGQLEYKRQKVIDALTRIGKIENPQVDPTLPSPTPWNYRNKIQLPVTEKGMGLYAKNSHRLIPIEKCDIHHPIGEKVFAKLRTFQLPSLKHLLIRTSHFEQKALVVLVTEGKEDLTPFAEQLMNEIDELVGVVQNINPEETNRVLGEKWITLKGRNFLKEEILGEIFEFSAPAFFQVNPFHAPNLYTQALNYANLTGNETVLDGYCGIGILSFLAAKEAKEVIGIESVIQAVQDGRRQAPPNCRFIEGKIEEKIKHLPPFDVAFLNPPRKGCEEALLHKIEAKTLIYISCDPATLARDAAILGSRYRFIEATPIDMFPQTSHIETVAKFTIKEL